MKKIVVIGPESTGKSSLCEALAKHYHTIWCREYAREYLLKNGANYSYENLLEIAKGQIALEAEGGRRKAEEDEKAGEVRKTGEDRRSREGGRKKAANKQRTTNNEQQTTNNFLFIDTDMYVMKVWCEYVFNKCHSYILEQIATRKYDLYLLCNTDLAWVSDELREYPDEKNRVELFHIYKDILVNQNTPFAIISGQGGERVKNAIRFIDAMQWYYTN